MLFKSCLFSTIYFRSKFADEENDEMMNDETLDATGTETKKEKA